MIERHGLGERLRREPAPAAEEIGQLPLSEPDGARESGEIDILGAGFAEIGDGGADGLVVVLGGESRVLCHGHEIVPLVGSRDPIFTSSP